MNEQTHLVNNCKDSGQARRPQGQNIIKQPALKSSGSQEMSRYASKK